MRRSTNKIGFWYNYDFYRRSPDKNPVCSSMNIQELRVLRGGEYFYNASFSNVFIRQCDKILSRIQTFGLRLAL